MKTFTIGKKFNKQIGLRYADSFLLYFLTTLLKIDFACRDLVFQLVLHLNQEIEYKVSNFQVPLLFIFKDRAGIKRSVTNTDVARPVQKRFPSRFRKEFP